MIVRLIELNTEAELLGIPRCNGHIYFCKDKLTAYVDLNDNREIIDFVNKVSTLPTLPDPDKVYMLSTDAKLYRYDHEWYQVTSLSEIFDLIVDNEVTIGCYIMQNGRTISPITSSELVIRENGENIEDSIKAAEYEIKCNLNPYYRYIPIDTDGQTRFVLPLPFDTYLDEGNTLTIYVNKVKKSEPTDYNIDYPNRSIDFTVGLPKATLIEVVFHHIVGNPVNVKQETIISQDKVRTYALDNSYVPGTNTLSLYINGIKQPKSAFVETSSTAITLNGDIPKESIMIVEIGNVVPTTDNFYQYFNEDKIIRRLPNSIEITYTGMERTRKIVQNLDSKSRIIKETAYLDGLAVAVRNIVYDDINNTQTYTHTIL